MRSAAWQVGLVLGVLLAFEVSPGVVYGLMGRVLDSLDRMETLAPEALRGHGPAAFRGRPRRAGPAYAGEFPRRALRSPSANRSRRWRTQPPPMLLGLVVSGGVRRALVRVGEEDFLVGAGRSAGGYRVRAIGNDGVRLVGRHRVFDLRLVWRAPSRDAAPAADLSPVPPAAAPPAGRRPPPRKGFFRDGQDADILLSGIGFNNSGGPLLFNHPGGIASDGQRLFLSDRYNNRVLVWNHAPTANVTPDFVLGQNDFVSNDPGTGRGQMSWPSGVSAARGRLVVADSLNNRVLIWKSVPTASGTPADMVLKDDELTWPWAVWTDGDRLIVTSTFHQEVLIWNHFPASGQQPPDLRLAAREPGAGGENLFGTPRTIVCDGRSLLIGDHNAKLAPPPGLKGCFVWKQFPTAADQPFDYFMTEPGPHQVAFMNGIFTPSGDLLLLGENLHLWKEVPATALTPPSDTLDMQRFDTGDGRGLAMADGRTYVCACNGDRVLGYEGLPSDPPAFSLGSPSVDVNPLETHGIISNPQPATDGVHLFVASDFDGTLSIFRNLPQQDNALPDQIVKVGIGPQGIALLGERLALAGKQTLLLWDHLPLRGEAPTARLTGAGGVAFEGLGSVAMDNAYFYLADVEESAIYAWVGVPAADRAPAVVIRLADSMIGRLSSDGTYLAFSCRKSQESQSEIQILPVADLGKEVAPRILTGFGGPNLPTPLLAGGGIFVADTATSRVLAWRRTEDALAGQPADAILGGNPVPEIGRNRLFWPASLAFDGRYLWIGEYKFSERLLRFSLP